MVTKTRTEADFLHDINEIRLALGHEWGPEQEPIILCNEREILGAGGERGGKSYVAAEFFNVRFWEGDLYWIAAKDYDRCHEEFGYIAKAMIAIGAVLPDDVHTPQNGQWHMKLNTGATVKTWSLKDWLKVGFEAPDGIIIAEVAQITHTEYTRLCDRTAEKRGWVVGTGTFESSLGWFPEKWKLYQLPGQAGKSFSLPSWCNRHVYPGGEQDPEILRLKAKYPEDYFLERFGGVPCPPKGLVFPEFRYLIHVKEMEVQDAPVYLWIDPGYAGAYSVEVVQIAGEVVHVVDEIYEQGLVTEQIIDICMQRPWWRLVAGGAVDIYAMQHQAMPAVAEVWLAKAHLSLSAQRVDEAAGRERLHTFLTVNPIDHQPRFFVDPKCVGILSEFGVAPNPFTEEAAPFKWKEDRTGAVVGQQPEDKNNHGIKAVIYGLIDRFGYVTRKRESSEASSYL
ncbi:hypothetical protein ES703_62573 [subsurface metagenome]